MNEPNIKDNNKYFEDNPNALVGHHIDSYNDFLKMVLPGFSRKKIHFVLSKSIMILQKTLI